MRSVPPLFVHASSEATHVDETREFKDDADAAQQAEYWRKLYVAMTRAEDELYVTGYLTKQGKVDGSWYEAIEQGLAPLSETLTDAEGSVTARVYPAERPMPAPIAPSEATSPPATRSLVLEKLPRHRPVPIVRPSSVDKAADPQRVLATRLEESLDPESARLAGTALHALLQHLGKVQPAQRPSVAARALETLLPTAPAQHAPLAAKALSIIGKPELAHLFGPNSRAEVPFFAEAQRGTERVRIIGRIDRIVVNPGSILLVDFKSDAEPVMELSQVKSAYLQQLALYALVARELFPGQEVEAAILWTSLESLIKLPPVALAEAAGGFTIR
jgi:ATP-dependent helicase/nuclease subunit A